MCVCRCGWCRHATAAPLAAAEWWCATAPTTVPAVRAPAPAAQRAAAPAGRARATTQTLTHLLAATAALCAGAAGAHSVLARLALLFVASSLASPA